MLIMMNSTEAALITFKYNMLPNKSCLNLNRNIKMSSNMKSLKTNQNVFI